MHSCILPDLPPDIAWLFTISQTLEAYDTYLNPSNSLPSYAPKGSHTRPFSISNIFWSGPTSPQRQRCYDLHDGLLAPGALPDAIGDDLLLVDPAEIAHDRDQIINEARAGLHKLFDGHVQDVPDPITTYDTVDAGETIVAWEMADSGGFGDGYILRPPAVYKNVHALTVGGEQHNTDVRWLCEQMVTVWQIALRDAEIVTHPADLRGHREYRRTTYPARAAA